MLVQPLLLSAIKNNLRQFELFSTGLGEFINDNLHSVINMPGSIKTKISMQKKAISFKNHTNQDNLP